MLLEDDDFEDFGTTDSLRSDAITQLISEIKKGLIDKKIFTSSYYTWFCKLVWYFIN